MPGHRLPRTTTFEGRSEELDRLLGFAVDGRGVASIQGIGGSGKSALAAEVIARVEGPTFVWSFYVQPDPDAFLAALYEDVAGEPLSAYGAGRVDAVLEILRSRPALVVLDGLERVQSPDPPHALEEAGLQHFLEVVAGGETMCRALVTTRFPLPVDGLIVPLAGLSVEEGVALLRRRGAAVEDDDLRTLARRCEGHALTLTLAAGALGRLVDAERLHEMLDAGGFGVDLGDEEERLTRILLYYREKLSPEALALLSRICLFRRPVSEETLEKLFVGKEIGGALLDVDSARLKDLLEELHDLGLIAPAAEGEWAAHAVVHAFFPLELSRRVHSEVAHFLSERAVSRAPRTLQDFDLLEDLIHHALEAGFMNVAVDVYWSRLGASSWLVECGELARGERIVRAILERLPETKLISLPEWRPRLLNELAMYLDEQARLDEAAGYYWLALRWRLREDRPGDTSHLLQNLADNCLLRGLLPLAEKLAAKAAILAMTPDDLMSCRLYEAYVRHLRGMAADATYWEVVASPGTASIFAVAVLLSLGQTATALALAKKNYEVVAGVHHATEHRALLQAVHATACRALEKGFSPIQTANLALQGSSLRRVIEWARRHGNRPLLAEALLLRARLLRLARVDDSARADLAEAEALARRHGLRLLAVDILLERSLHDGIECVREASRLAGRRDTDYGLAASQASKLLAWRDEPTVTELRSRARSLGRPLLEGADDLEDTGELPGCGRLDSVLPACGPGGRPLLLPVDRAFHERVSAPLEQRIQELWETYYMSHRVDTDVPGPCYHVAVLLLWAGLLTHVDVVAEDLMQRSDAPLAAACLRAAAHNAHPAQALDILRKAIATHHDQPPLHEAAAWYAVGVFEEARGHLPAACEAYDHALRADRRLKEARERRAAIDLAAEERARCKLVIDQVHHALEVARRRHPQAIYPPDLATLDRLGFIRHVTCPSSSEPLRYYLSKTGARHLIACSLHRLRYDSSLGDLSAESASTPPENPPLLAALQSLKWKPPFQLRVTAHRIHKIID